MVEIVVLASRSLVVPFKGISLVMLRYVVRVTLLSALNHVFEFLPPVRSFLGKITQQLWLVSHQEVGFHGRVRVCIKPAKLSFLAFPTDWGKIAALLEEVLEKGGSCQL